MKKLQVLILALIFIVIVGGSLFFIRQQNKIIPNITPIATQAENVAQNINTNQINQPITEQIMDETTTTPMIDETIKNFSHEVTIQTNMGEIVFLTYDMDAPLAVSNFITLAQKDFYNSVIFHRVIDKFMIQGGDPTGTGMGGPGYKFADELNPATESYQAGYATGTVAMANSGPNTNGSQFFIMVDNYPLPNNYTIFGKVIKGQEIANAIAQVAKDANDKPLTPVVMEKVSVIEVEAE